MTIDEFKELLDNCYFDAKVVVDVPQVQFLPRGFNTDMSVLWAETIVGMLEKS